MTLEGDTFDSIALDFYNNEFKASDIIRANPEYTTTLIFSEGKELKVPVIETTIPQTLPPWKRG